jgi:superfamily II DNA or RNA helicase
MQLPSRLVNVTLTATTVNKEDLFFNFFQALLLNKTNLKELSQVAIEIEKCVQQNPDTFSSIKDPVYIIKEEARTLISKNKLTIEEYFDITSAIENIWKAVKLFFSLKRLLEDESKDYLYRKKFLMEVLKEDTVKRKTMLNSFFSFYYSKYMPFLKQIAGDSLLEHPLKELFTEINSGVIVIDDSTDDKKSNNDGLDTQSQLSRSSSESSVKTLKKKILKTPVAKLTQKTNCKKKLANFKPQINFHLENYQKQPAERLRGQKGLLLMYETGSGKTITAIHTAYTLLKDGIVDRVLFLVLANSEKECNFNKEVLQYLHTYNLVNDWFHLDESCISMSKEEKMCIISHTMFYKKYSKEPEFRSYISQSKTLLIIDESHVMANALDPNLKKGSNKVYLPTTSSCLLHACTNATKVLLLTATPLRNSIEDLYPIYLSLVESKIDFDLSYNKKKIDKATVLIKRIAHELKVNGKIKFILNHDQLRLRFQNLVLFKENDTTDFAVIKYVDDNFKEHDDYYDVKKNRWNVVTSEMSEEETKMMEDSKVKKNKTQRFDYDDSEYTQFNTNNFLVKSMLNKVAHLSISQFQKLKEIIDHYRDEAFPLIVYSTYVENGIEEIKTFMKTLGFREYSTSSSSSSSSSDTLVTKRIFSVITGQTTNRQEIVRAFNKGLIDIIILSDAGATGTDLRGSTGVRQIHILNINWSSSAIQQTVGRGWRKGAHKLLREEDRKIRVFIYLSKSYRAEKPDEIMMDYVSEKKKLVDQFRTVAKEYFNVEKVSSKSSSSSSSSDVINLVDD